MLFAITWFGAVIWNALWTSVPFSPLFPGQFIAKSFGASLLPTLAGYAGSLLNPIGGIVGSAALGAVSGAGKVRGDIYDISRSTAIDADVAERMLTGGLQGAIGAAPIGILLYLTRRNQIRKKTAEKLDKTPVTSDGNTPDTKMPTQSASKEKTDESPSPQPGKTHTQEIEKTNTTSPQPSA
jgi:hypothetical protein